MNAKAEIVTAATKRADKKVVAEFYRRMPAMQRLDSVRAELNWYLTTEESSTPHEKCLPEYCYHIFEKFRLTYLRSYPKFSDTITGEVAGLADCKDLEQVKGLIKVDWFRVGKVFGMLMREKRFLEMESEPLLKREGLLGQPMDREKLALVCDESMLPIDQAGSPILDVGELLARTLRQDTGPHLEKLSGGVEYFDRLAYLWGSDAQADFNRGKASGLTELLDGEGQFVGESTRANLYWFLLLAWPEIKPMLEAEPKKTVTDLHEWMLPFMREDITSLIGADTLRDVCAPPPSGIGLSLRPLKSRRHQASD